MTRPATAVAPNPRPSRPARCRRRALRILPAVLLAAGCATGTAGGAGSLVGAPAPELSALDVSGRPTSLASFKGAKHVVLVFYIGHT